MPIPWPMRCLKSASVAGRPRSAAAGAVHLARGHARPERGPAGLLRREDELVRVADLGFRLADAHGAAEVRAVAVDDRAEVEHDDVALLDGRRCGSPPPSSCRRRSSVKTCVVNEGTREPWSTHLVLDLLDELEHRRARPDLRRDRAHRRRRTRAQARSITASSSGDFVRRSSFTSAEPVTTRSGDERLGQVEQRLGPDPVADRERLRRARGRAPPPRTAPARRRARSTTTSSPGSSPATSNSVIIRGRTKTGSRFGRKNAPATQPCAYCDWPNVGIDALDAREVLEIGRRREEEEVDAGLAHPLGEPAPPLRVVEHDHESRHRGTSCETAADARNDDLRPAGDRRADRGPLGLRARRSATTSRSPSRAACVSRAGRHFCLYALSAVIPLLPAKQRTTARRGLARAGDPRRLPRRRGAADHADRADRRADDALRRPDLTPGSGGAGRARSRSRSSRTSDPRSTASSRAWPSAAGSTSSRSTTISSSSPRSTHSC